MDNHAIFIKEVLVDKVKIKPTNLGKNIREILTHILVKKYEGICSHHGYIKPGSIEILKHSSGQLLTVSLNGDVIYNVVFKAEVCNPMVGCHVTAKVINMNKFGILAEAGIMIGSSHTPILEIIIAKNTIDIASNVNLEAIKIGDIISVEILGKKYELMDKKISIVGKIVAKGASKAEVRNATTVDYESDGQDEVDEIQEGGDIDEVDELDEDGEAEAEGDVESREKEVDAEVEDDAEEIKLDDKEEDEESSDGDWDGGDGDEGSEGDDEGSDGDASEV